MTTAEELGGPLGIEGGSAKPEEVNYGNSLSLLADPAGAASPSSGIEGELFSLPRPSDGRGIKGEGSISCLSASDGERAGVRWFQIRIPTRLIQFTKFCFVGGSGVVVDMGLLYLLADPKCLGLNVTLSKIIAAEVAMINNFIWNELWTFRATEPLKSEIPNAKSSGKSILRRFLTFNAICGIGIGIAVLLLHLFHTWLGWNLYLSNLAAIAVVTSWNFLSNARCTWRTRV